MRLPRAGWLALDVLALVVIAGTIFVAVRDPRGSRPIPLPSEGPLTTIAIDGKTANYRGTFDVSTAKEPAFEMETGLFYYEPTVIEAPARTQMVAEIGNESRARHTFTIRELGIDREIGPFEMTAFLLDAPAPGEYLIICRYHADQGMRGELRIEDTA